MIWNLKISLPLLNLTALEILSTNYMYILLKLEPGSLLLAIELHQPGIHFYHELKKHHLLTNSKVFLTKIQIY